MFVFVFKWSVAGVLHCSNQPLSRGCSWASFMTVLVCGKTNADKNRFIYKYFVPDWIIYTRRLLNNKVIIRHREMVSSQIGKLYGCKYELQHLEQHLQPLIRLAIAVIDFCKYSRLQSMGLALITVVGQCIGCRLRNEQAKM